MLESPRKLCAQCNAMGFLRSDDSETVRMGCDVEKAQLQRNELRTVSPSRDRVSYCFTLWPCRWPQFGFEVSFEADSNHRLLGLAR